MNSTAPNCRCPVCLGETVSTVYTIDRAPIYAATSRENTAEQLFGKLAIVECRQCGHMFNSAYDPNVAECMYADTFISNMPINVDMVGKLEQIKNWIGAELLDGKHVLEIGAGSGHLSRVMAKHAARVDVFEPCKGLSPDLLPEANICLHNMPFVAEGLDRQFDIVVCRQVIEHVSDPGGLLREIAHVIKPGGYAYLEVPNAAYIRSHALACEFHQAHVQYFSKDGFRYIADMAGLVAEREWSLKFDHDFGVLFRKAANPKPTLAPPTWADDGDDIADRLLEARRAAEAKIQTLPEPIGVYGATWQSASLINSMAAAFTPDVVFDDNGDMEGAVVYGGTRPISISKPSATAIDPLGSIIIGAYLHAQGISERIRTTGWAGEIVTAGPLPPDAEKLRMMSLVVPPS